MLKNKNLFWLIVILLVVIDQLIELFVWHFLMDYGGTQIIGDLVTFYPVQNLNGTFLHSVMGTYANHLFTHILNFLLLYVVLGLRQYLTVKNVNSKIIDMGLLFFIIHRICFFIDLAFWGGSLDFIRIRGLFIFGPENVYLAIAAVCMVIYYVTNYRVVDKIGGKEVKAFFKFCFSKKMFERAD